MTNNFRTMIQSKLNTIDGLDSGEVISDNLIEEGKYYFGWKTKTVGTRYNLDYSNENRIITFTGYLATKGGNISKLDGFTDDIISALSELRLICSNEDITTVGSKIRKTLITGTVRYDILDGLLK